MLIGVSLAKAPHPRTVQGKKFGNFITWQNLSRNWPNTLRYMEEEEFPAVFVWLNDSSKEVPRRRVLDLQISSC